MGLRWFWAILRKGTDASTDVMIVDLQRTFESKTLVIDKVIITPLAGCDCFWINNTLHTLHFALLASLYRVFNTNTKEIVHTFSCPPFYGHNLGPHHLYFVDTSQVMSVFHSSDLTTPCRVHHLAVAALPVQLQPTYGGFVPVIVPPSTAAAEMAWNHTHTSKCVILDLSDAISGVVLARMHGT
ncbi:hypothetical protein Pelo_18787 [Pelomyxa schiedti]|nr:hypothetical protein Pelo_18787 [Pelomyxa schiedti]